MANNATTLDRVPHHKHLKIPPCGRCFFEITEFAQTKGCTPFKSRYWRIVTNDWLQANTAWSNAINEELEHAQ